MKIRSLKMLSLVLALAFVLSAVPSKSVSASKASKPTISLGTNGINEGTSMHYIKSNISRGMLTAYIGNTKKTGHLTITISGRKIKDITLFDKMGVGSGFKVLSLPSLEAGYYTVTAVYDQVNVETAEKQISIRVYDGKAYAFCEQASKAFDRLEGDTRLYSYAVDLSTGIASGKDIIKRIAGSHSTLKSNKMLVIDAWVESLYKGILGRDSDPSGKQFWINKIVSGNYKDTVYEEIFNEFLHTDEFKGRMESLGYNW